MILPNLPATAISLRPADQDDCRRIWEWRNEPESRRASFNSDAIPFEKHAEWFAEKLIATDKRILVVLDADGKEIGYVRFSIDESKNEAEISVGLDKSEQGKGYGTKAIKQGSDQLLAAKAVKRIVAMVKKDNPASIAAFQKAGFAVADPKEVPETDFFEMVYAGG